jgi:hypothetical protein
MTVIRVSVFAVLTLGIAACMSTKPIPIEPSKPMVRALESERDQSDISTVPASTRKPTVVAVCYNSMVNDDAEILAAALKSCPAGRLTLREDDRFWTQCPLLQPERANFVCVPESLPELQ